MAHRTWIKAFVISLALVLSIGQSSLGQRSRKSSTKAKSTSQTKPKAVKKTARKARVSTKSKRRSVRSSSKRTRRGRTTARRPATRKRPVSTSRTAPSIPQPRVLQIQRALSRAGYLEVEPSSEYDQATIDAMKRFQKANRLRATGLPSAHSLKRLGVPKGSGDGYSIPINNTAEVSKKPD